MLSRRAALTAAALAPVTALTIAGGAGAMPVMADKVDWAAIVARLELIIETLGSRYVRKGFQFDHDLAREVLAHCRDYCRPHSEEAEDIDPLVYFVWLYGQSLDWILTGDPAVMICHGAARPFWREPGRLAGVIRAKPATAGFPRLSDARG